jgi:hypothetical protein
MRSDVGDEVSIDPVVHERMLDNGAVFFQIDLPAFATFVPDREGMRASGVPLTVVGEPQQLVRGGGLAGRGDRGRAYGAARAPRGLLEPPGAVHRVGASHYPLRWCSPYLFDTPRNDIRVWCSHGSTHSTVTRPSTPAAVVGMCPACA